MNIKFFQGRITLEKKVIDLSGFQVRSKITTEDLERDYDCFIEHAGEIKNYFEDKKAFNRVISDAAEKKRPKLVARETKYPFMMAFRSSFMLDFLTPSRRLQNDYFITPHCMTRIPIKKRIDKSEKHLDQKLRGDLEEKFKQYQEYEGVIEIPNDRTPAETKSSGFHESLHYVIARYQAETGRSFVNVFIREDLEQLEKYQFESLMNERAVEMLTDKLLSHDPDAQFENRWLAYSINNHFNTMSGGACAIATAALVGTLISQPYLLALSLVPGRIRDYANNSYKNSKREELLKPREYPKFKI